MHSLHFKRIAVFNLRRKIALTDPARLCQNIFLSISLHSDFPGADGGDRKCLNFIGAGNLLRELISGMKLTEIRQIADAGSRIIQVNPEDPFPMERHLMIRRILQHIGNSIYG